MKAVYVKRNGQYVRKGTPQRRKHKGASPATPLPFFIVIAALIGLGIWAMTDKEETGYTQMEIGQLSQLLDDADKPIMPLTKKQRQAAVLKDLWQLSEDDVARPVRIFGEP